MSDSNEWPSRLLDLKHELVSATTEEHLTASWNEILAELAKRTAEIAQAGTDFIPQVNFADLEKLTSEEIDVIRRKGTVVIHDVVDSKTATDWKTGLYEFIKANPDAPGLPPNDKQFWALFWTPSQVQARAHPNVLKATAWLNKLFHIRSGKTLEGVDLSVPLIYADRFRTRHPGTNWSSYFPPHLENGAMDRWEDKTFRRCFEDILTGNWRQYDPYDLEHRLAAPRSLYGEPGQPTPFRAFQGWLAMAEIAPTQGTLCVFPDVQLSNAYTILRPFFRPIVSVDSPDIFDSKNWKFDISTAEFPGVKPQGLNEIMWITPQRHPHLRLEETMTSVPKVKPGDMVFWHCDVVHCVETEHSGDTDSTVMYIPAVPKTPLNSAYLVKQAEAFLAGQNPPDGPQDATALVGLGVDADVKEPTSRVAMGLPIQVA